MNISRLKNWQLCKINNDETCGCSDLKPIVLSREWSHLMVQ